LLLEIQNGVLVCLVIAANNIMEEFGCPVFVWGREGRDIIKGSCRSDGTVNLVELMASTTEGFFLGQVVMN